LILLGLGAAGAVALAGYDAAQGEPHPELIAAAAAANSLFFLRWWFVARARRWFTPTENGFILEDQEGTRSFTFDEISDLATASTIRYDGGVPRRTVRRGTIVTNDCRVPFHYEFPLSQPDPLGFFFNSVERCLIERAKAALAAGATVRGERWEWTATGLTLQSQRCEQYVDAEEISAVAVVAEHVCVWTRGESHPSIRIPVGSANALVLLYLLDENLTARGIDPDEGVGGLGRVLFERGKSNLFALLAVTLVFASVFAAIGAAADGISGALVGVVMFAVIASPLLLIVALTANFFRCHARGVYCRSLWRTREIRFEDVGRFSYGAVRNYHHGIHTGTHVRMRFEPKTGGRPVTFAGPIKDGDVDLDSLRDHVSRAIAANLLHELQQGECVGWTEGLRFRPEGLEWTKPGGMFSRRVTRIIPYAEIAGTDIQQGHFYLFLCGVTKAVYTTPVAADNFFPGLVLLNMVQQRSAIGHPQSLAAER